MIGLGSFQNGKIYLYFTKKLYTFWIPIAFFGNVLLQAVQIRAEAFTAAGRQVVITGDLNISPHPFDHCSPDVKEFLAGRPDRRWLHGLTEPGRGAFVDGFRIFHPDRYAAALKRLTVAW